LGFHDQNSNVARNTLLQLLQRKVTNEVVTVKDVGHKAGVMHGISVRDRDRRAVTSAYEA
jgi:hypothetical protein